MALQASTRPVASKHSTAAKLLAIIMLMMRHHGDDVYMMSQPITVQTETSLF